MDASAPRPSPLRHEDTFEDDQLWLALRAIQVEPPPSAHVMDGAQARALRSVAIAPARSLRPTIDETGTDAVDLPFCTDGDFAAYFECLAEAAAPALAVVRRLALHIDAELTPEQRVSLYRCLWRTVRSSAVAVRAKTARLFDQRHAGLVAWCERPWSDPLTHRRLAQAHLPGVSAERLEWQGPQDAGFVVALLSGKAGSSDEASTGHDGDLADASTTDATGDTLGDHADAAPDSLDPASMLVGLQACLQGMPCGSLVDRHLAGIWRQATLDVAAADPTLRLDALRTLFLLALAEGDTFFADSALADCVREQAHVELTPAMFCRWLQADDAAAGPLQLAPALDAKWCRPQALHSASFRAALSGAFRRPSTLARLAALERNLVDAPTPPLDLEDRIPTQVLRALSRLDAAWQRLGDRRPIGRSAASLLSSGCPGNEATAVLQRSVGIEAIAAGHPHAANIAFGAARSAGCRDASRLLQQLVESIDEAAWKAAADETGRHWWHVLPASPLELGQGWQVEEPIWLQLARHGTPVIAAMAAYQLAVLYSDGCLQPCDGARRSAPLLALALWTELLGEPAYAAEAARRLDSGAMRAVSAYGFQQDGVDWLCVPSTEPDADRLLIVFTGFEKRHGFDSLELVNGFEGHHLLFLHDPHGTGYSGDAFERLCELVRAHVDTVFDPARVTCHGSGMGAAGALKTAMHFGFQAVVVNPSMQHGLDAAFDRRRREAHDNRDDQGDVSEWPVEAFEHSPVCLLVGARPADREAFTLWLAKIRQCRDGRFIVEKFDDQTEDHDFRDGRDGRDGRHGHGLLRRVAAKRGWVATLSSMIDRLGELASPGERIHAEVPAALLPRFWERLDEAPRLKLEIVIADGRVFVADSLHTGTSASAP
ncbi:MAG: hypothetical protein JWQ11_1522 [Rhizobacter sp.]|nr:hypothetical protein [Rhizobacter sp.]